jgi:hypothetical protein
MNSYTSLASVLAVALVSCTPPKPLPEVNEPVAPTKEVELEPTAPTPLPEPTVGKPLDPPPVAEPSIEPVLKFTGAFATPESVLYDPTGDRYLVSNINGDPSAVDGNGYILELSPDGRVTNPKLIAGGMNKVRLDAPKGMAIVGSELWVADLTVVRKFDLKTAAHRGDIQLPAATFANDIAATPDGGAYVSDSAVKFVDGAPQPSGTDQIFLIDKAGKVKVLASSGAQRSTALPDVPTFNELGVKGVEAMGWFGFFAPPKTPKAIVDQLNKALNQVLADKETIKRMEDHGADVKTGTPEELRSLVQSELVKWKRVVQQGKLTAD